MAEKFDCIVIGAGAAGLNIAGFMNKAGFRVLLVDKSDERIGGDCLNFGCVPSKALIHVARLAHSARVAKQFGIKTAGSVDISKVNKHINGAKAVFRRHENKAYLESIGISVVLGEAKFVGKRSIEVAGVEYAAKRIVIATGSRPRTLDIPGIDQVSSLHTNESIFSLKKLPKRLVVIGGGPIGAELGQAFARFGSKVTIVQHGQHFLERENQEIAQVVLDQFEREGITIHTSSSPVRFIDGKTLVINTAGSERSVAFDAVLVSIGRKLNIPSGLESAGIKAAESGKLVVDRFLRTSNKRVYVCGDVVGGPQFTHAAELHASIILRNFFSPLKKPCSLDHLSWVTYTDPEVATFGLSEAELKRRGVKYEVVSQDFSKVDRGITDGAKGKLILFVGSGKLHGGSLVAPHAGEMVQELILANSSNLSVKSLFNKVYPYPTASRINKQAITKLFAGKLTNFNKRLLRVLFKFS